LQAKSQWQEKVLHAKGSNEKIDRLTQGEEGIKGKPEGTGKNLKEGETEWGEEKKTRWHQKGGQSKARGGYYRRQV